MAKVINNVRLNSNALFIHRLIRALQQKRGFCWASNETLAKQAGVSKGYLAHQLSALDKAGLIYRNIVLDDRKEFVYRQIVAFSEAKETAIAEAEFKKLIADKTETGIRNRLIVNGRNLCIAPQLIIKAILKHGAKRVDEALAIVKASHTCISPIKYFFKALKEGWTAGKRASRFIGEVFRGAQRRIVNLPKLDFEEIRHEKEVASYANDSALTLKEKFAILKANLMRSKA